MNVSQDIVPNLIASITTKAGLKIQNELDRGEFPAGQNDQEKKEWKNPLSPYCGCF